MEFEPTLTDVDVLADDDDEEEEDASDDDEGADDGALRTYNEFETCKPSAACLVVVCCGCSFVALPLSLLSLSLVRLLSDSDSFAAALLLAFSFNIVRIFGSNSRAFICFKAIL